MVHLNSLKPYLLLINKGVEKGCIEIDLRNKINSLIKNLRKNTSNTLMQK